MIVWRDDAWCPIHPSLLRSTKRATLFLAHRHDGLEVFLAQYFLILTIPRVNLALGILDDADVASTFTRVATAILIPPIVAFTGLNSGNLLGQLVL